MLKLSAADVKAFAWGLSLAAVVSSIVVWGQGLGWSLAGFNNYLLFPLFGLLAFSLMWSHYIASVVRQIAGINKLVLKQYFETTSYLVLFFIFAHPGILAYQLARDGLDLPPRSFYTFAGPSLAWAVTLGLMAFLLFITFEFRRKFADRSWWQYVMMAIDLAFVGIYFHALSLGTHVQSGWYRYVWLFYGATLALALTYIYWQKFTTRRSRVQL